MSTRTPTGAVAYGRRLRTEGGVSSTPDAAPFSHARALTVRQFEISTSTPKIRITPRVYCSRWLPDSWRLVPRTIIGGALT
jgi:hypothetical protein